MFQRQRSDVYSSASFVRECGKFTYISLNIQTASPPRTAVPVWVQNSVSGFLQLMLEHALIERLGLARVKVVASVTQKNLGAALSECVSQEAIMNTDEHPAYRNPLKHWKAHHTVNHLRREYQRRSPDGSNASTNTAESFFSLLKRAIIGAWHHVSREHLAKYANEFAFRWNTRHDSDVIRLAKFVREIEGKRLMYRHVSQTLCVC